MEEAVKKDQGKDVFDSLPWKAIAKVGRVMDFGKNKYSKGNYLKGKGLDYSRLFNACLRHLIAWDSREESDPESGESHLAHAACCVLMLLELRLRGKGIDDRLDIDGLYEKIKQEYPTTISKLEDEKPSMDQLENLMKNPVIFIDNEPSPIVQLRQLAKEAWRHYDKPDMDDDLIVIQYCLGETICYQHNMGSLQFGAIVFPDKKTAQEAIDTIGEENLIQAFRKELGIE